MERVPVDWLRLKLDLETFDDAAFEHCLQRCRDAGLEFTDMAELGDTAAHRRALYELNKTCSADIPQRGEFYTFDEYLAERIDIPSYDPRGVVLAIERTRWVGMSATSLLPAEGCAFSEMTGVLHSRPPAPAHGRALAPVERAPTLVAICFVIAKAEVSRAGLQWRLQPAEASTRTVPPNDVVTVDVLHLRSADVLLHRDGPPCPPQGGRDERGAGIRSLTNGRNGSSSTRRSCPDSWLSTSVPATAH